MQKILNILDGKKTYIVAVVIAVLNLAVAFGWISPEYMVQINLILGALGISTIRAAINKVQMYNIALIIYVIICVGMMVYAAKKYH